MDKGGVLRWLFFGLTAMVMVLVMPKLFGGGTTTQQPLGYEYVEEQPGRAPEAYCDLWTPEYRAQVSTWGGSLEHFELLTAKYRKGGQPIRVTTTPDVEDRQQLRLHLRNEALGHLPPEEWQVQWDRLDYALRVADGKRCELVHRSERVEITRVISVTDIPYQLSAHVTVKNLADRPLTHAATIETVAWRTQAETEGGMFRVSPFLTHVECAATSGKVLRKTPHDFDADDFDDPAFAKSDLNPGSWMNSAGTPAYAGVSNAYFAHALMPEGGGVEPQCHMQVEHRGAAGGAPTGSMYRSRLAWPARRLAPGESASYAVQSFIGPKERDLLARAGDGRHHLTELIDLGFFSVIAKVLVGFLLKVHSVIPNWGVAIILLTLTARVITFPLSVPGIKSMVRMRELKPEMDALNEKYKDDAQAKGLAQMELWRKHDVNPLKGCLPQMASMPVWFALYTTLQTAVELYNIPFLWFPDLSEPDHWYILPFVIGATNFVQQRMMPMTGGDPAQQKMMLYVMPAMFTVFMLFLPAGLGVYMFTNGLLSIGQQHLVEWHVRRTTGIDRDGKGGIQVKVKS